MWGWDFVHNAAGLLMLVSGPGAMNCAVPEAPKVVVTPRTAEIVYDYSKSIQELGQIARQKRSTPNPLHDDPNAYVSGLRSDKPRTDTRVTVNGVTETYGDKPTRVCLWYSRVELVIDLQPVIYLARERDVPGVCREEILAHERRHVQVDREVMNQFAQDVGRAIQAEVQRAGAQGPYPAVNTEAVRNQMAARVNDLVDRHVKAMTQVLERRQAQVDSREEYERISALCRSERAAGAQQERERSYSRSPQGRMRAP